MEKRKLGRSALEIAPFTLGGNVFGWTIDETSSFKVLDAFVDQGFSMIDTADVYSKWKPGNNGGESEAIIGKWLKQKGNRSKVLIATKVGGDMGQGKNLTKKYILEATNASLTRLQTDYIDLYQSHWDDVKTPVEETLSAYDELIREGKVRLIGASNFSTERLAESLDFSEKNGLARYETFQPRYNLFDREEYEKDYMQLCLQRHVSVIPYYGLASGFLTGKYRSKDDLTKSARGGGIETYLNNRGHKILKALDAVAAKYNSQPATVALAWLKARPGITAPIASATTVDQLKQLTASVNIHLDNNSMNELNEASELETVIPNA